jgi:hypothetical protein
MYKFECFCTKFIRKEILKSLSTPSANDNGSFDTAYKSWTLVNRQSLSSKSVSDVSVDTNNSF